MFFLILRLRLRLTTAIAVVVFCAGSNEAQTNKSSTFFVVVIDVPLKLSLEPFGKLDSRTDNIDSRPIYVVFVNESELSGSDHLGNTFVELLDEIIGCFLVPNTHDVSVSFFHRFQSALDKVDA